MTKVKVINEREKWVMMVVPCDMKLGNMKALKLIRGWDLPWEERGYLFVCHVVNIGPTLSPTQFHYSNFPPFINVLVLLRASYNSEFIN